MIRTFVSAALLVAACLAAPASAQTSPGGGARAARFRAHCGFALWLIARAIR